MELSEDRIRQMFDSIREYRHTRRQQQARGLNDFNVFTILLDATDERRLHSRFLALLLDPRGAHGQGDLFLRSFLRQVVGMDARLDPAKCEVSTEYAPSSGERIDIFITHGNTRLAIENKVYAQDGEKQIQRYVEVIAPEQKQLQDPRTCTIVYLSLDRGDPSPNSLGEYEIVQYESGKALQKRGNTQDDVRCLYRAITYDRHIREWIREVQAQVANITNLNVALTQYLDVIDTLYGCYKEKTMNLAAYLKPNGHWKLKDLRDLKILADGFPEVKMRFIEDLLLQSLELLKEKFELSPDWRVDPVPHISKTKSKSAIRIVRQDLPCFGYALVFEKKEFHEPYFSVSYFDFPPETTGLMKKAKDKFGKDNLRNRLAPEVRTENTEGVCWKLALTDEKDLFQLGLEQGVEGAALRVTDDYHHFFRSTMSLMDEFVRLLQPNAYGTD